MVEKILTTGKNNYFRSKDFANLAWEMLETKYPEETKKVMEAEKVDIYKIEEAIDFLVVSILYFEDRLVLHEYRWDGNTYVAILKAV